MHPFNKVEYTAGLEKKLGEDISLSARFLHSRIIWAVEDMGLEGLGEFYVGNPGSEWIAQIYRDKLNPDVPSPPKAKRNYYSLSIGLDKRFSHRWMGGVHYTWSYLWGNYSGLADSDTHANIQPWPNYEYSFDYWFLNRDQNMNETTGKLRTDRPHFLKVYGSYSFDFGLTIGLYSFVSSGIPLSRRMQIWWKPTYYPVGRKSDGRTPMLNRTDLYLEYNLRLGGKNRLQLNANISNMFNQKIVQAKWEIYNQQNVFLTTEEILAGFDYQDVVKNQGVDLDPRFMMPFKYQSPIDVRLGIKFIF
jgi:hypothetical protein